MADAYTTTDLVRAYAGFEGNVDITDPIITVYADQANAEVAGKIGTRYLVPLGDNNTTYTGSGAEKLLKGIATQLGAGRLFGHTFSGQGEETESVGMLYVQSAYKLLKGISKGEIILEGIDGAELALSQDYASTIVSTTSSTSKNRVCLNTIF